jgi:hypothetical protein
MRTEEAASLVDALGDAFAAGDRDRALAAFVSDGDVVYVGSEPGEVAFGHRALRTLLGALFDRDERYRWRCHSAHVAETPDGVVIVAETILTVEPVTETTDAAGEVVSLPYRVTGLLERSPHGWRWRLCQGSEPATGQPT